MKLKIANKVLGSIYLFIFTLVVLAIVALHLFPKDFLDFARLPTFLNQISPLMGVQFPTALLVYQITLVYFLFLILTDGIFLMRLSSKRSREISAALSLVGAFLMAGVATFFVCWLFLIGFLESQVLFSAIFYLSLVLFLFLLDLFTFFIEEESID